MPTNANTMLQLARTLSQPAQVQEPQNFDGQIGQINRDYGLADALAQQQYIPNSGWLGALAQAVSGLGSYYVGKRADKAAGEVGAKVEAQRQAQEAARAEAEARKQAEQYAREDSRFQAQEAARMARIQAQEDARNKRHAEKLAAEMEKGRGGAKAPSLMDLLSPEERARAARIKAGLEPEAKAPPDVNKPPSKDERIAAAKAREAQNALNILGQMEGILDSTGPLDQYFPGENQARFKALEAQLLNSFKGATRGPGEGTFTEGDAAALRAALPQLGTRQEVNKQTIDSLRSQLNAITGGQPAAPAAESARSDATTSAPAVGAVKNGYRFKGGDPAKRENWEKV